MYLWLTVAMKSLPGQQVRLQLGSPRMSKGIGIYNADSSFYVTHACLVYVRVIIFVCEQWQGYRGTLQGLDFDVDCVLG